MKLFSNEYSGFIIICFHAIKLIRLKFGLFVAFIFVLGLLSFITKSNNDDKAKSQYHELSFNNNNTKVSLLKDLSTWSISDSSALFYNYKKSKQIEIDKNLLFSIGLHIGYGSEKETGNLAAIYAYSYIEGIISGIEWKPFTPIVFLENPVKTISYSVGGVIEWKLLNMVIYSEVKNFSGNINVE